ncbi:MAG TPA: hypothetical protein VFZ34_20600 [Blastocatellia bacterium]|nr:hypothetical protein [Blastocatellia bacterium]
MNRFLQLALAFGICGSFLAPVIRAMEAPSAYAVQPVKVLREYKGIKLGLKRADVRGALGPPESTGATSDDFKLTGEDMMTVHYDNEAVKAIQLAFFDPKNAPAWKEVVGDAETTELPTGAKTARKELPEEKFWVSIYQNKEGTVVRITISR